MRIKTSRKAAEDSSESASKKKARKIYKKLKSKKDSSVRRHKPCHSPAIIRAMSGKCGIPSSNDIETFSAASTSSVVGDVYSNAKLDDVCERKEELAFVTKHMIDFLEGSKNFSLYISGTTGTGKTLCVRHVIAKLSKLYRYEHMMINCVSFNSERSILRFIYDKLANNEVKLNMQQLSRRLEEAFRTSNTPIAIVFDEIDYIKSKCNSFLYIVYGWRARFPKVSVIETFLTFNKNQPFSGDDVVKCFAKLTGLIENRALNRRAENVDVKAIELCSRKISSMTGDVRVAIQISQQFLSRNGSQKKEATCGYVLGTISNIYDSPIHRIRLPFQQKIILAVMLRLSKQLSTKSITKDFLEMSYQRACEHLQLKCMCGSDFNDSMILLESQSILVKKSLCYVLLIDHQMRPLNDEESEVFFKKLSKYVGDNVKSLIERGDDSVYCFRLHKDRVYYCNEALMKKAACISREQLLSFGTCMGKFTKTKRFHIHITALDYLAPYAKYRIWVKPQAEQQFLYGNNVVKSGIGRMSDNISPNRGVIVFNMNDLPIGFGVTTKGTAECRKADPAALIVLHQCDLGEYLRNEAKLT